MTQNKQNINTSPVTMKQSNSTVVSHIWLLIFQGQISFFLNLKFELDVIIHLTLLYFEHFIWVVQFCEEVNLAFNDTWIFLEFWCTCILFVMFIKNMCSSHSRIICLHCIVRLRCLGDKVSSVQSFSQLEHIHILVLWWCIETDMNRFPMLSLNMREPQGFGALVNYKDVKLDEHFLSVSYCDWLHDCPSSYWRFICGLLFIVLPFKSLFPLVSAQQNFTFNS